MNAVRDLAHWGIGAALGLAGACGAIMLTGAVDEGVCLRDVRTWRIEGSSVELQRMAFGAAAFIGLLIPLEVADRERGILALRFVPNRNVWLNLLVVDHPVEHGRTAVGGVADQSIGSDVETILHPLHHGFGGLDF